MTYSSDPNECAICGEGLYEGGPRGNPQRIGEKREILNTTDAARKMQGNDERTREARGSFSIKVGFCPDCFKEHGLGEDDDGELSDVYDQMSLWRANLVPERDL